ncbi:hypothetical protein [Nocardia sp. NPDC004860]|uniref:hypothetical protein n=1 Tax=Nocardia sp. NPDC004860 TaxID=3154557 RepID=UPI0033B65829
MRRIAVETISILAVALGAVFSAAACSTGESTQQAGSAMTSLSTATSTSAYPQSFVDDVHIITDYAKTDPEIFEKFNTYHNKFTGEAREFFDSNGQPNMDTIIHNRETFFEARYVLIPNDFYQQELQRVQDSPVKQSPTTVKPTS